MRRFRTDLGAEVKAGKKKDEDGIMYSVGVLFSYWKMLWLWLTSKVAEGEIKHMLCHFFNSGFITLLTNPTYHTLPPSQKCSNLRSLP